MAKRLEESCKMPKTFLNCEYTVSQCRGDDSLYGPIHGSYFLKETICGLRIENNNWYVVDNMFEGKITCKKCLRES